MPVSRYAPSPTGPLHLGNLRTALLAWLQARLSGATFILRIEDLDLPRVKPGSTTQIIEDLLWLGLDWDQGPQPETAPDLFSQSKRSQFYLKALDHLHSKDLIYPCYCSRRDIRQAASAPHGPMPVYPGTCRNKYPSVSPGNELQIEGRQPAWRFKVSAADIEFEDCLMGPVSQNPAKEVGDFVIRRSDGLFAYQLAVVVDDAQMGVTDVLRGEDLLDSTCRQIALFKALDAAIPRFWHVGLMRDEQGRRMSKRDGSLSLQVLRDKGKTASQVVGELAYSCGLLKTTQAISVEELLHQLTAEKFVTMLKAQEN